MKFDMIYLMNLIFILSISTCLFIYFKGYFFSRKKNFNKVILIYTDKERFNYCTNLTLDKYNTYEKIDIWRYCSLF
ncbi:MULTISPECIES: hypothetical protein [unclassified Clostridium]|uniref:hypothetical protein n=1 Tax=unclassified Clostridium TaxID=2614128 RepID=UPI0029062AC5|nr:hypothetical protein [Clostridium sp.]MDU5108071.1 hypothetical protein [Clostridium sp.]